MIPSSIPLKNLLGMTIPSSVTRSFIIFLLCCYCLNHDFLKPGNPVIFVNPCSESYRNASNPSANSIAFKTSFMRSGERVDINAPIFDL